MNLPVGSVPLLLWCMLLPPSAHPLFLPFRPPHPFLSVRSAGQRAAPAPRANGIANNLPYLNHHLLPPLPWLELPLGPLLSPPPSPFFKPTAVLGLTRPQMTNGDAEVLGAPSSRGSQRRAQHLRASPCPELELLDQRCPCAGGVTCPNLSALRTQSPILPTPDISLDQPGKPLPTSPPATLTVPLRRTQPPKPRRRTDKHHKKKVLLVQTPNTVFKNEKPSGSEGWKTPFQHGSSFGVVSGDGNAHGPILYLTPSPASASTCSEHPGEALGAAGFTPPKRKAKGWEGQKEQLPSGLIPRPSRPSAGDLASAPATPVRRFVLLTGLRRGVKNPFARTISFLRAQPG